MWCCFLWSWFRSQSSDLPGKWARCIRGFGLHPAIIIRGFAFTKGPTRSPLIGCCQAAATARCRNTKTKQIQPKQVSKPAVKRRQCGKQCLPLYPCDLITHMGNVEQNTILMCIMGSPKQTHTNCNHPCGAVLAGLVSGDIFLLFRLQSQAKLFFSGFRGNLAFISITVLSCGLGTSYRCQVVSLR